MTESEGGKYGRKMITKRMSGRSRGKKETLPAERKQNHSPTQTRTMCVMIQSKMRPALIMLLSSIKMELCITHIIFCGAIEERGPPYSMEENKGCG